MKRIVWLLAGIALGLAQRPARPQGGAPPRLALLVGIDEYAAGTNTTGKFPPLRGAKNDVRLVGELLQRRFGFGSREIVMLLDERATHRRIVESVAGLIRRAGPQTEVLLWFSGHGSRVPDNSDRPGAELQWKDSTLLAHDSRAAGRRGSYDITDDELHSLLAALCGKTSRVTIVTDACHSGGSMRGGALGGARGVRAGTEPLRAELLAKFWPEDVPLLDDDDPRRRDLASGYVHVSACANDQVALEYAPGIRRKGRRLFHGGLTWFLVKALRDARPGETYRQVLERTACLVATNVPGQSVWFEGALDRELFGARFKARPSGFPGRAGRAGRVAIDAGHLFGLRIGGRLEVRDLEGRELGEVELGDVGMTSANAKWLARKLRVPAGTPVRVVPRAPAERVRKLRVHVANQDLRERLASSAWITPVAAARADYDLERDGESDTLVFATSEGVALWRSRERDRIDHGLEWTFRKEVQYRALRELAVRKSELRLKLRFVAPTRAELAGPAPDGWDVTMSAAGVKARRAQHDYAARVPDFRDDATTGRLAVLEVVNASSEDLHVTILSIGENREINVLWPPEGVRDQVVLHDGGPVRVPLQVGTDAEWPLARPMRERYLAVATRKYVDFHPFVQKSRMRGALPRTELAGALRFALTAPWARAAVPASAAGWGVASVDLRLHRAKPRKR